MRVADAYLARKDKLPRRDSASSAMLPLYHRTVRFLSDPYKRMKKRALLMAVAALVVLYVLLVSFARDPSAVAPRDVAIHDRPGFQAPKRPLMPVDGNAKHHGRDGEDDDDDMNRPRPGGLRRDGDDEEDPPLDDMGMAEPPQPIVAAKPPREHGADDQIAHDGGGGAGGVDGEDTTTKAAPPTPASKLPYFVRMVLPLLAGFCFGFLGSVPVAGPTSAMVLKLGIQGKYQTALTIAFGGAISEATYAGVAFWGFGSFLAGAKFLLPVSKVLGAVMFTIVGIVFLKSEVKSPLDIDPASASHKGMRARPPRDEFLRNILMGLTMSGINPSLLATYTGAIASVYGTGLLDFTLFLAFVFGIGVCCGVSTWFFILVSLLQKYKQRLKKQTIGYIMRGMGCFLLTLGALCAKSSFEYFVWGVAETKP